MLLEKCKFYFKIQDTYIYIVHTSVFIVSNISVKNNANCSERDEPTGKLELQHPV